MYIIFVRTAREARSLCGRHCKSYCSPIDYKFIAIASLLAPYRVALMLIFPPDLPSFFVMPCAIPKARQRTIASKKKKYVEKNKSPWLFQFISFSNVTWVSTGGKGSCDEEADYDDDDNDGHWGSRWENTYLSRRYASICELCTNREC